MRSAAHFIALSLWGATALFALPLPAFSEPVRVTEMNFEVLEDAEVVRVRSDGELEIEVRELDQDTLSIGLRGAVLEDRARARIVPEGNQVVRVVTATPAVDARGPLVRIRIEHAPGRRPVIEATQSGLSAVFAKPEAGDSEPGISATFRSVPVAQLIQQIAAKNGETLLLTAPISQRVSLLGPRRMSRGELSALLDTVLLMQSRVAVPMPGGGRKIMNATGAPLPWVPEMPEDPDDSPLVTLVRLEHVDSALLLGVLHPLLGRLTLGTAHAPTNSILLAGSGARVARLRRAMLALDKEPEEEVLVITLRNRSADEVLDLLNRAFDEGEIVDSQRDLRTNTLLLRVRASKVPELRGMISRLDRKVDLGGRLHVFPVRYADPERLAEQLNELQSNRVKDPRRGAAGLAGRSFSVEVHEPTSTLLLVADIDTARIVSDLLAVLDILPPRVRVDVTMLEVVTDSSFEVGFDAFLPFGTYFRGGTLGGFVVSAPSAGGASGLLAGGGGDGFVGRMTRAPLLVPITDALGNVVDISVPREVFQLDADESSSVVRVMHNPSLLVSSGDEQSIFAGNNVPVLVGNQNAANPLQISSNVERHDTGISLRVKPTVGIEGLVELELFVEESHLSSSAEGAMERVGPSFSERTVETTIHLPSGALAVIGFAALPYFEKVEMGVPFLRSIPVLGLLFRSRKVVERKATLLVAVRADVEGPDHQALSRALQRELALPLPEPAPASPAPPGSG